MEIMIGSILLFIVAVSSTYIYDRYKLFQAKRAVIISTKPSRPAPSSSKMMANDPSINPSRRYSFKPDAELAKLIEDASLRAAKTALSQRKNQPSIQEALSELEEVIKKLEQQARQKPRIKR